MVRSATWDLQHGDYDNFVLGGSLCAEVVPYNDPVR
jgi:hypothetical protein